MWKTWYGITRKKELLVPKFNIIPEIDQLVMQAVMRYVWPRWRGKKEALDRAVYYVTEGHRRRRYWRCERCGKEKLGPSERQTDHRHPRTPVTGYDNLQAWIARTLCEAEDLDVLCLSCHSEKTKKEAGERAEVRRNKKKPRKTAKKTKKKGKRAKR